MRTLSIEISDNGFYNLHYIQLGAGATTSLTYKKADAPELLELIAHLLESASPVVTPVVKSSPVSKLLKRMSR